MVTEFYPPAWRGILSYAYVQKVNSKANHEKIMFRVLRPEGDFAVQLYCRYHLGRELTKLIDIRYHVASISKGITLAEVFMAESQEESTKLLLWQASLDLGNENVTFDLDKSDRRKWILDINITEKQGP
jgi:hypothetical protein